MIDTTEKKLTVNEWLKKNDLDLDKNEVIWLSTQVARKFRELYPDEPPKKVYRPNDRGKYVAVGYGYDDRALSIMNDFIEM